MLLAALVALAGLSVAPAGASNRTPKGCTGFDADDGRDRSAGWRRTQRCVRINQIQVMGTHNSYKLDATPQILDALTALDPVLASEIEYRHVPLAEQFDTQEIRQIELDVFADPEGGLSPTARRSLLWACPTSPTRRCSSPATRCFTSRRSTSTRAV